MILKSKQIKFIFKPHFAAFFLRTSMKKILLISLLFSSINAGAAKYYELTKRLVLAQEHISTLRLIPAEILIMEEIKQNPDNLASLYYLNYIECYRLLISQNKSDYAKYKSKLDERINEFDNWETNSNQKQISLSQFELQYGFAKIIFNEYIGAALNFRAAFKYSKLLRDKEPANLTNQKNYGLLYAAIGTFPDQYKWALRSIGLDGNFKEGMNILNDFIQKSKPKTDLKVEHSEAIFAYSYLMLNFGKSKKATWDFVKNHTLNYQESIAEAYLRALTAEKCFQSEECIKVISKKPQSLEFEQISTFDYLLGSAKLNLLEMDGDVWLKKYVTFSSSNFLKKDAYRKLSWYSLISGNLEKFKVYRALSLKLNEQSIEENVVSKDIENGIYPNKNLLKARLFSDAGLFKKSLLVCQTISVSELKSTYQKIEFEYRQARNYQEMEMDAKARYHYKLCLDFQNPPPTYYLPNACLQIAYISERNGELIQAKTFYNKVINFKNYEYKQSIHQEAKNGLVSLKLIKN